ncbi:MAG TPA: hypothetical protein VF170_19355, partial [Planctomycetaceae bacterium]
MPRRPFVRSARLLAAAALVGLLCGDAAAGEKRKPVVTKLTVDPSAREVELFEAIEEEELAVRMIPKDSKGGNLLIENKTDQPLTVKMPPGFVGVQVFKQIGGGLGGGGGQQVGGGAGGLGGGGLGGGGLGGGGAGGGGFFSIPAETVARVPYTSVCLEHGKPEPSSRMTYEIRPVEEVTDDETLQALIALVGSGKIDADVAQAAAWHLTDGMSWAQLAALKNERLGGL